MKKRFFVQAGCGHCERETTFRLLSEKDELRRTVMVCTDCGRRQPKPVEPERDAGR